ncbi:cytochrome b subunit of succinate dehydrogenase, Sdh3p [Mycoemilia scoparia]|uniref:Cytochrome b subunit of succinate dehydrogenase, Sdh3p n=1 Tax=Mycoemilia scoparia TaxID=417184 RepID=A0A9W7ZWF0_9FUNG|nr:cytochrome b subunit of succinate dehydrogenase, Sdh3p [Mycoemilia scoparia]
MFAMNNRAGASLVLKRAGVLGSTATRNSLRLKPFIAPTLRVLSTSANPVKSQGSSATSGSVEQTKISELAKKNRPISPHLTIYQPQITWYLSSAHRITGVAVCGAAYLGCISFGLASLTGAADLSSMSVASSIASSVPTPLLILVKAFVSGTFSFHFFNGLRHLTWDSGRQLTLKGVYNTAYATLAGTAIATTYFTFF